MTNGFRKQDKITSRLDTVIKAYRQWSGRDAIPAGQVLLSLCNRQFRSADSELGQYELAGLIEPQQYHGCDLRADLIRANRRSWPEATWHTGPVQETAAGLADLGVDPGLVFADFCNWNGVFSRKGGYFTGPRPGHLPELLDSLSGHPLVVVNVLTRSPRSEWAGFGPITPQDLTRTLKRWVYPRGYRRVPGMARQYDYRGKNGETMTTFWLEKR